MSNILLHGSHWIHHNKPNNNSTPWSSSPPESPPASAPPTPATPRAPPPTPSPAATTPSQPTSWSAACKARSPLRPPPSEKKTFPPSPAHTTSRAFNRPFLRMTTDSSVPPPDLKPEVGNRNSQTYFRSRTTLATSSRRCSTWSSSVDLLFAVGAFTPRDRRAMRIIAPTAESHLNPGTRRRAGRTVRGKFR